jgi:hypothetical protein
MTKKLTVKQIIDKKISKKEDGLRNDPENNWVQAFFFDIATYKNLSPKEIVLFQQLATRIDKHNMIYLNSALRKRLMEDVGYDSLGSLAARLCDLRKAGLIVNVSRNTYMVNPKYFNVGTLYDIRTKNDTFKSLTIKIEHRPKKEPNFSLDIKTEKTEKKRKARVLRAVENEKTLAPNSKTGT